MSSFDKAWDFVKKDDFFSQLDRAVDHGDVPLPKCPDCGEQVKVRTEGERSPWASCKCHPDPIVKQERPVKVRHREVPEDHPDGEYTWMCPFCGEENQEYSSNQSSFSPFRFSGDAGVKCFACGEEVAITE